METYFIYYAEVKKPIVYGRARRIMKELLGVAEPMTPLESETCYLYKINHKKLFDLSTLKVKKMSEELTLVVGKLKDRPPHFTMNVKNPLPAE